MTLSGHSYSCPAYFEKATCTNTTRFSGPSLEALVIRALRERLLPKIKDLELEVNRILASGGNEDKLADLRNEVSQLEASVKNRVANASRMALDKEMLRYVTGLIAQERSRLNECRQAITALERQTKCLTIDTGLIKDALENLDKVLDTDLEMAREFLAAMVERILVHPLSDTKGHRQGIRCPLCGLSIKKLTPQHAAKHGLSVEEMATAYPQFGVSQPVEVRIGLNMKDLLAKEEVVYCMVAGARNFDIYDLDTFTIALQVKWLRASRHRRSAKRMPLVQETPRRPLRPRLSFHVDQFSGFWTCLERVDT